MSQIKVYADHQPTVVVEQATDGSAIADILGAVGVRFERWQATHEVTPDMDQAAIINAYQREIDRLKHEGGYVTVDVVNMHPEHPQKDEFRKKFLEEHTHGEDEVRFFVAGQGLFSLHIDNKVYAVLCTQNDLISVPANTPHWFDMGPEPHFSAIRLFNNPEGWVAQFTGTPIAANFPRFDTL
ncbi:MAG: cupin [Gammaproteobacteria bacterium]|nr:cupin [Gammaproteobacteria bacterium]